MGDFVELLIKSNKATSTIRNYVSAIKQYYEERETNGMKLVFRSLAWRAMLRSLAFTVKPGLDRRLAITRE